MTIHVLAIVTDKEEIARLEPYEVEGYGAACGDCGAILTCDTPEEQEQLHQQRRPCPNCGGIYNVCACSGCIKGGPY